MHALLRTFTRNTEAFSLDHVKNFEECINEDMDVLTIIRSLLIVVLLFAI